MRRFALIFAASCALAVPLGASPMARATTPCRADTTIAHLAHLTSEVDGLEDPDVGVRGVVELERDVGNLAFLRQRAVGAAPWEQQIVLQYTEAPR
jgi:hypothetical protein